MPDSLDSQIIAVFNKWGRNLVDDTQGAIDAAIKADGGGQTSKLSGSVNYKVLNQGGEISFQLTMNDYWKFQNYGVDGTKVSHGSKFKFRKKNISQKAMLNFINARHFKIELSTRSKQLNKSLKTKGIRQQHKRLTIDQAKKNLAFVLGRSIAQKGIKPLHFMEKVITPQRMDELKAMLAGVIKKDFVLDIK